MTEDKRATYQRRVTDLEAFGDRGSATENEKKAAAYLAEELRDIGLEPEVRPFKGSRSMGARILVHVLLAALSAVAMWWEPVLGFVALLAFGSLAIENTIGVPLLSAGLVRHPSRNVVATIPPAEGPTKARVVVLGHYDTQRTGLMWREELVKRLAPRLAKSPGITKSPLFGVILAIGLQTVATVIALIAPASIAWQILVGVSLAIYALAGFVLGEWSVGPYVPGANDNATGSCAVISLGEQWLQNPVPATEIVLLLTGCEETGLIGANAYAKGNLPFKDVPTTFLNIDSLGYGRPRFVDMEYSLAGTPVRYPADMVALAQRVASHMKLTEAGPRQLPVATDAIPFLLRGCAGMSVLTFLDNGHTPNYHQLTDTSDRLDFDVAWEAVEYSWNLLVAMAEYAQV